ncbi:MAG: hypothetical protein ABI903_15380 [Actinomycetota bacterium]
MFNRGRNQSTVPAGALSREKQLALLIGAALAGLLLLIGLGYAVYYSIHPASPAARPHSSIPRGQATAGPPGPDDPTRARRDDLAARPMPPGSAAEAHPSVLSTRDPGFIMLPPSTTSGPVGVPAGFEHTPAGALAQLAAIDKAALDSVSLGGARAVIEGWAAPGGPTAATWSGVKAMADFLSAAGLSAGKAPNLALTATPIMGLVKAADGPGWVVACVDFEVDATLARTARVALADCQRMAWQANRWVIGPGAEPAPAPSLWPGTDAAIDAGYKELRNG